MFKFKTMTAVSAVLVMSAAVTFGVRAQDPTPAPAGDAPAVAAPAAAAAAEPPRDPKAVVAKVGNLTVTEREVSLAQEASVKTLALFHHEPMHDDTVLAEIEKDAKARAAKGKPKVKLFSAREGMVVDV